MELPILLTLDKLLKPIINTQRRITDIAQQTKCNKSSPICAEGLFVLAVASFETMINDVLFVFLQCFPQKMDIRDMKLSKDELLSEEILNTVIEKYLIALSYKNLYENIDVLIKTLSINDGFVAYYLDNLLEIKERRNLLLHNNLVVNDTYLERLNGHLKEDACSRGEQLAIDDKYFRSSLETLTLFLDGLINEVTTKYKEYTRIKAIKSLWEYLFQSPIMVFEDYWHIDYEKDVLFAWKKGKYEDGISNSERLFLGMLRSHLSGHGDYLQGFDMVHFGSRRRRQMLYLLSILGDFRLY